MTAGSPGINNGLELFSCIFSIHPGICSTPTSTKASNHGENFECIIYCAQRDDLCRNPSMQPRLMCSPTLSCFVYSHQHHNLKGAIALPFILHVAIPSASQPTHPIAMVRNQSCGFGNIPPRRNTLNREARVFFSQCMVDHGFGGCTVFGVAA
jgi:hypothetical protein